MKSIFAPHLGTAVKLGRSRPIARGPRLKLVNYMTGVPNAPPSVDYSPAAKSILSDVMLNDQLGDCVIAGGYHLLGTWGANANGAGFHASSQQLETDYGKIGGYVVGDESTDQGCDEQTALNYWTQTGFADGSKLAGWASLAGCNASHIMQACWLFGGLYFGMELPDAWVQGMPSQSGFTWDKAGASDPSNGHCVVGVGYDTTKGVLICTWGLLGWLTWDAIAAYADGSAGGELYTLLSPDFVSKATAKSPSGFDLAALESDVKLVAA